MCTIMGCAGAFARDKTAWLASTSDNPYKEGPRKPMWLTVTPRGRRVAHTPCLRHEPGGEITDLGSDRGLTDAGLAWTRSWVVPGEREHSGAIPPAQWFMRLADECTTVSEAIAFIADGPKGKGCQGNYMLADATGAFACMEVGYTITRVAVTSLAGAPAYACRANLFVLPEMAALDLSPTANTAYAATSPARKIRAEGLVTTARGTLDVGTWQAILADTKGICLPPQTDHGPSICSAGIGHGTVSAEIMHPATLSFWYTYGWPDPKAALDPTFTGPPLIPWGKWRRFDPSTMPEPGSYTTWHGALTPLGKSYCNE